MDFKRIRIQQEFLARKEHEKKYGDNEVTFAEIWERIEREVGIPANEGMKAELEAEECFCFANPFMLELFNALKEDPDVEAGLDERPIGGLGIYLVKTTMDNVDYEHKDTGRALCQPGILCLSG